MQGDVFQPIIAQLVSAQGDVNKCNDSGESPIFVAARLRSCLHLEQNPAAATKVSRL